MRHYGAFVKYDRYYFTGSYIVLLLLLSIVKKHPADLAGDFYSIGGKQSPPVSGQQLKPCSPMSV